MSIFDNPAAFEPFFDEAVTIVANRPDGKVVRGTFHACVMPVAFDDTLVDVDVATNRKRFAISIPAVGVGAWIEAAIGSAPQIGDEVKLCSGLKAAVTSVEPLSGSFWQMEVREQ